jgi:hypothetical protein
MSTLIFQVHIKQWDKGQRSDEHVAARADTPLRYRINKEPAYFVLNKACIIDQHGDDIATNMYPHGRIKTGLLPDGSITLDRFHISQSAEGEILSYQAPNQDPIHIGLLKQNWIQCRYQWRYKVKEGGMNYWMYEEFVLNAASIDDDINNDDNKNNNNRDYFLTTEPELSLDLS